MVYCLAEKMFLFEKWLSTKNGAGCNSAGVAWGN